MKVLVIDDSSVHQQSARQTLGEHELTVITSHDEAYEALENAFFGRRGVVMWDAVLCDLLMPVGARECSNSPLVGQEMPVGWALAIQAALYGAKYVAVLTDLNHHEHPASAMLDSIKGSSFLINQTRALFAAWPGDVEVEIEVKKTCHVCQGSRRRDHFDRERKMLVEGVCDICNGTGTVPRKGKHWGKLLQYLVEDDGET